MTSTRVEVGVTCTCARTSGGYFCVRAQLINVDYQRICMPHPTTLPPDQRQHLAAAVERRGVAAVARALGIGREAVGKLVGGVAVRRGTVALAQTELPRLNARLASAHRETAAA